MMSTTKKRIGYVASWIFLIVMLILMYLPLVLVVVYSFNSSANIGDAGGAFTFQNYKNLFFDDKLMEAAKNTLLIGLVSSLIATLVGTVTAVGIFYMKRGKKIINTISQVTVVNAEIVTAVGFFLLFIFLRDIVDLPIKKGLWWLILTHSVITVPYVILSVSPRLGQLNPNLFEAGMDLGAGAFRTLMTVIFPQLIGGMVSGFALAFTLSLDDFVVTKMNTGNGIDTISTYVYDALKHKLSPSVRALSTIIFVVVLVVLIIINLLGKKKKGKV